jgi:hypothetical protein
MTTDGWIVASTIATGAAAIATGASAVFIAAQTRATKDALTEARNSLKLSNTQAQQSLRLVIEAVKTRLDSRSPRLTSRLLSGTASPHSFWLSDDNSESAELSPVQVGDEFNSPQQDHKYLWAAVIIEIHNDGPGSADITFHPAARRLAGGGIAEGSVPGVTLRHKDSSKHLLLVGTTIDGWIQAGALRAEGKPSRLAQGSWQALLKEQEGVAQYQRLEFEGSILRDLGQGRWRLVGTTDTHNCPAYLQENGIVRTYVLDVHADELLPEVDWASMTPPPLDLSKEEVSA